MRSLRLVPASTLLATSLLATSLLATSPLAISLLRVTVLGLVLSAHPAVADDAPAVPKARQAPFEGPFAGAPTSLGGAPVGYGIRKAVEAFRERGQLTPGIVRRNDKRETSGLVLEKE